MVDASDETPDIEGNEDGKRVWITSFEHVGNAVRIRLSNGDYIDGATQVIPVSDGAPKITIEFPYNDLMERGRK